MKWLCLIQICSLVCSTTDSVFIFTCPALNWSPPNADTHGLMPPVPIPIRNNATAGPYLEKYGIQLNAIVKIIRHMNNCTIKVLFKFH